MKLYQDLILEVKSAKKARRLSMMFPGLGQIYAGEKTKGYRWMGIGAVSLIGTFSMLSNYLSNVDAYDIAEADYLSETDPAIMQQKFTVYENLGKDKTNRLIGSAGFGTSFMALWIWNMIDINRIIPSELELKTGLSMQINERGQLEASIAF